MKPNGHKKTKTNGNNGNGNKKTNGDDDHKKVRRVDVRVASAVALGMLLAPIPTIAVIVGALIGSKRNQKKQK